MVVFSLQSVCVEVIHTNCHSMHSPTVGKYRHGSREDEQVCLILGNMENSSSTMSPLTLLTPYSTSTESSLQEEDIGSEEATHHPLQKPIFTVLYISVVLFLFLYGIYAISGEENVEYGMISPISPPIEGMYFTTASEWPYCEDRRPQWWRLFSHQLIHAGYLHVLSNQLMLLIFGSFYEANQGFLRTCITFELSIVAGCMGHAAVWPLRPLIGNSHGVYGLFGACFAEVLVNADSMPRKQTILLLLMFLTQLSLDIMGFVLWFNPHVGYSAHTAGFFSGLLTSFIFSSSDIKRLWKYVISVFSIIIFTSGLWYLLDHYETTWPPEALISPSWSEVSSQTCCADALYYQEDMDISQEEVVELFSCSGYDLVEKYQ